MIFFGCSAQGYAASVGNTTSLSPSPSDQINNHFVVLVCRISCCNNRTHSAQILAPLDSRRKYNTIHCAPHGRCQHVKNLPAMINRQLWSRSDSQRRQGAAWASGWSPAIWSTREKPPETCHAARQKLIGTQLPITGLLRGNPAILSAKRVSRTRSTYVCR